MRASDLRAGLAESRFSWSTDEIVERRGGQASLHFFLYERPRLLAKISDIGGYLLCSTVLSVLVSRALTKARISSLLRRFATHFLKGRMFPLIYTNLRE
jgi:hypothetical protein